MSNIECRISNVKVKKAAQSDQVTFDIRHSTFDIRYLCFVFLATFFAGSSPAADWPQWRGPDRNAISKETGLLKKWPKEGPPLLWTYKNAGLGLSGPAIVGDRLYLMGARDKEEYVFVLDLKNIKDGAPQELWSVKIGPEFTWKGNTWNQGPGSTPTVDGDLVYALGGFGDLVSVDAATGKERWRKSMTKDLQGEVNNIGGSQAPYGWG